MAQPAVELEPDSPPGRFLLALVLLRAGRTEVAVDEYEGAATAARNRPDVGAGALALIDDAKADLGASVACRVAAAAGVAEAEAVLDEALAGLTEEGPPDGVVRAQADAGRHLRAASWPSELDHYVALCSHPTSPTFGRHASAGTTTTAASSAAATWRSCVGGPTAFAEQGAADRPLAAVDVVVPHRAVREARAAGHDLTTPLGQELLKGRLSFTGDRAVVASFAGVVEAQVQSPRSFDKLLWKLFAERRLAEDEFVVWACRTAATGTVMVNRKGGVDVELTVDPALVAGVLGWRGPRCRRHVRRRLPGVDPDERLQPHRRRAQQRAQRRRRRGGRGGAGLRGRRGSTRPRSRTCRCPS